MREILQNQNDFSLKVMCDKCYSNLFINLIEKKVISAVIELQRVNKVLGDILEDIQEVRDKI